MGDRNSRKITPQEAKRHSYERDCVNTWCDNKKAARTAIPRFKAASRRQERHAEEEQLRFASARSLADDVSFEAIERKIVRARFKGRNPERTKFRDEPLLVVLERRKPPDLGPKLSYAKRRESVRVPLTDVQRPVGLRLPAMGDVE